MAILSESDIKKRMKLPSYEQKLLITPLLSEDQVGPASVDIRLGSSIIIPQKTYVESQDVTNRIDAEQIEQRSYRRIRLKYGSKFVLHPNQLILGATFEYLSLPNDLSCIVATRSSWGRLGLVIATASVVQPGFKGCLTLELSNLSESPISLYPGLLIGQLLFSQVTWEGVVPQPYTGRYRCPTEAEPPQFYAKKSDAEMEFWRRE